MPCVIAISVIVCTYRRNQVLRETLECLTRQASSTVEILVVDQQASHDTETASWLRNAISNGLIRYFDRPRPGLTAARNFGMEQASGEILLFCDDDIVPVANLITAHARNYEDPAVAAVAGQVLHRGEDSQHAPGTFRHNLRVESFGQLYGANFSIRKSAMRAIGGADENLGIHAYTEDVLMARALRAGGFRIVYDPDASVLHLAHPGGGCRITDQSQPTSEADRTHSKLYLFHKLHRAGDAGKWRALRDGFRHGPFRRQNVVKPWRQPWAWWSFVVSFLKARRDASANETKPESVPETVRNS